MRNEYLFQEAVPFSIIVIASIEGTNSFGCIYLALFIPFDED